MGGEPGFFRPEGDAAPTQVGAKPAADTWGWADAIDTLVAAGYTLADVHGMTLGQLKAYGDVAEGRRRKARTELLIMLRAARYGGKEGGRAYTALLKASRSATWLTPG